MSEERLYKILTHDAKSAHGGNMDWTPYLPHYEWNEDFSDGEWIPGSWYHHNGTNVMCRSGIHLTSEPLRWNVMKGRIFLAECRDAITDSSDKICVKSVRLLCELGIDSLVRGVRLFKLINSYSDLRNSDLSGSNLSYSYLSNSDLSNSDLSYSDLSYSDLSYSDLSGSNLRYSDLSGSNLRYSDLSGSNLSYSNLSGAFINTDPKISGWEFKNGRLWRVE